jgi:hypothetical protein
MARDQGKGCGVWPRRNQKNWDEADYWKPENVEKRRRDEQKGNTAGGGDRTR